MRKVIWNVLFYTGFGYLITSILFRQNLSELMGRNVADFLDGFAIAIMLVGLVFLLINRYSAEGVKKYELEENDERNIRIKEKAGYSAWYASIFLFGVLAMSFIFLRDTIDTLTCAWVVAGAAVLHRVIFEIFKVIYKKKM